MSTFSEILSSPNIRSTHTIPDFVSRDDWFTVPYKWVNKGVANLVLIQSLTLHLQMTGSLFNSSGLTYNP